MFEVDFMEWFSDEFLIDLLDIFVILVKQFNQFSEEFLLAKILL